MWLYVHLIRFNTSSSPDCFGELPESFPQAWRNLEIGTANRTTTPDPASSHAELHELGGRLCCIALHNRSVPTTPPPVAWTTEAVHALWPKPDPTPFLVPRAAPTRDVRLIHTSLDLAMRLGETISKLEHKVFGWCAETLQIMSTPPEYGNPLAASRVTYSVLIAMHGLADALRAGAGGALAPIFGGIAAAHPCLDRIHRRIVFERVATRIRNAGEILHSARKEQVVWMLLTRPYIDIDTFAPSERPLAPTVATVVALGDRMPLLTDLLMPAPSDTLAERQTCVIDAVDAMVGLPEWTLVDALVPCNAVPLRTSSFDRYIATVCTTVNRLVDSFAPQGGVCWPERNTAWVLVAAVGGVDDEEFAKRMKSASKRRAFEPPTRGAGAWMAARAVLTQFLDVDTLATLVRTNAKHEAVDDRRVFARLTALLLSTRTKVGAHLLVLSTDMHASIPLGLDVFALSPSGVLESVPDDGEAPLAMLAADQLSAALVADATDATARVCIRFSLISDNLLTHPWRKAIKDVQAPLERAMQRLVGRAALEGSEEALFAATLRRSCLRAMRNTATSTRRGARRVALVVWIASNEGRVCLFAREFVGDASDTPENAVIEYECALRRAMFVSDLCLTLRNAKRVDLSSRRVTVRAIGFDHPSVDSSTQATLADTANLDYVAFVSPETILKYGGCAVSVVVLGK